MEFIFLLEHAIDKIQNLKEYYETQIVGIEKRVEHEGEKYKYGILLEKYFLSLSMNVDMGLTDTDLKIIENIVSDIEKEEDEDRFSIRYKMKNIAELKGRYELNPRIAATEYLKLCEQPQILMESTLMMLLIRYEEAIAGIFRYVLAKYPEAYLKEKTITYSELMVMDKNIKEIKTRFVEKEVDELMRQPIGDWYKILEQKHKVKFLFNHNEFDMFREVYYRRNLIVHNQGIVNDVYLNSIDSKMFGEIQSGDSLKVDHKYLENAFEYTQMILYGTFWALRNLSKDKKEFENRLFEIAFEHMLNKEWALSEYVYSMLMNEKNQTEADRICSKVNYWISIKNQDRFDEIKNDVEELDVSAMSGQYKVAKQALLDNFVKVSEILENILGDEIKASYVEQWPLFIQYRDSIEYKEFRNNHYEKFEEMDYEPEAVTSEESESFVEEQ